MVQSRREFQIMRALVWCPANTFTHPSGHSERSEESRGCHPCGRDGFHWELMENHAAQECHARSFDSARRLASLRMTSSCMQLITRQLFRCADHAAVGERSLNLDDERSVDGRNITIVKSRACRPGHLPVDKVQPMVCAERLGTADQFIKAAGPLHSKILSRRNPHARNRRGQPFC